MSNKTTSILEDLGANGRISPTSSDAPSIFSGTDTIPEGSNEDYEEPSPQKPTQKPPKKPKPVKHSRQTLKSIVKIQSLARRNIAKLKAQELCRSITEQVYDPSSNRYFYYNTRTSESLWHKPYIMGNTEIDLVSQWGASTIQKMYRKKLARKALTNMAKSWYTKAYDPDSKQYYYVRKIDNTASWKKPVFIKEGDDVNIEDESKRFLERDNEIERLKKLVKEKDKLIKVTEKARFEELDAKLRDQRLMEAKEAPRGKFMEEWSMAEVVAWFDSLGFPELVTTLVENKVDGLLLLNMEEQDWTELGVISGLHRRKIAINMKKYQLRYETRAEREKRGKAKGSGSDSDSDDDDGLSDLSISTDPSELLDEMMDAEDMPGEVEDEDYEYDEEDLLPTEEELLERRRDKENVEIEVVYPGDGKSHPKKGDVVQLHYTLSLTATNRVIESSRKHRHRPFEFVVGTGQVIRGWDVAILQMSFGERSKVNIKSKYAYGAKGFPPVIPTGADLMCDMEIIKWWKRPVWIKPLKQVPGLSQKPHTKEEEQKSGSVAYMDVSEIPADNTTANNNNNSNAKGGGEDEFQ